MKAPDKICVAPHQIFDYDLEIQEVCHNGAEEYIRKNTLIEWASNMLGQVSDMGFDDGDVEHGYTRALQDIIDKLNSL